MVLYPATSIGIARPPSVQVEAGAGIEKWIATAENDADGGIVDGRYTVPMLQISRTIVLAQNKPISAWYNDYDILIPARSDVMGLRVRRG